MPKVVLQLRPALKQSSLDVPVKIETSFFTRLKSRTTTKRECQRLRTMARPKSLPCLLRKQISPLLLKPLRMLAAPSAAALMDVRRSWDFLTLLVSVA